MDLKTVKILINENFKTVKTQFIIKQIWYIVYSVQKTN